MLLAQHGRSALFCTRLPCCLPLKHAAAAPRLRTCRAMRGQSQGDDLPCAWSHAETDHEILVAQKLADLAGQYVAVHARRPMQASRPAHALLHARCARCAWESAASQLRSPLCAAPECAAR